ncbi:Uncharacterised protein [Campylobacter geochelonis]|uniref:Uncharacterized protein n=1 Tax=Campylobacter geochelonis TaxID=1780362 RepID=A0A128EI94_9BACT|nr:Uncharacterised protein [Campylobacter geochelonis]
MLEWSATRNNRYITFKNDSISYNSRNMLVDIKINDINSINQTFSIKYKRYGGMLYNKIAICFIIFFFFCMILNGIIFYTVSQTILLLFMLFIVFFTPKFILYIYNKGSIFNYKLFDAIVIKSGYKFINILPNSPKERLEIKKYFLQKNKINIDKTNKIFFII